MCYISNNFSLNMLESLNVNILVYDKAKPSFVLDVINSKPISYISSKTLLSLINTDLETSFEVNSDSLSLKENDVLYVIQYIGPKLEDGETILPEEAKFKYIKIKIV